MHVAGRWRHCNILRTAGFSTKKVGSYPCYSEGIRVEWFLPEVAKGMTADKMIDV